PAEYAARHRRALEMYGRWADDLPGASEDFLVEILFHQASLYRVDRDVDKLLATSRETLQFARKHLTDDRFLVVRMQFDEQKGDHEFLDLLPDAVRTSLIHNLD